jgi:hypothetical protein
MAGTPLPAWSTSAPSAAEETVLGQHADDFVAESYTIMRGVLNASEVAEARAMLDAMIAVKLAAHTAEQHTFLLHNTTVMLPLLRA